MRIIAKYAYKHTHTHILFGDASSIQKEIIKKQVYYVLQLDK